MTVAGDRADYRISYDNILSYQLSHWTGEYGNDTRPDALDLGNSTVCQGPYSGRLEKEKRVLPHVR